MCRAADIVNYYCEDGKSIGHIYKGWTLFKKVIQLGISNKAKLIGSMGIIELLFTKSGIRYFAMCMHTENSPDER